MILQGLCYRGLGFLVGCLVLSKEWGNGLWDYYWGLYRDYYTDPFPHSLLSTRQFLTIRVLGLRIQGLGRKLEPEILNPKIGHPDLVQRLKRWTPKPQNLKPKQQKRTLNPNSKTHTLYSKPYTLIPIP